MNEMLITITHSKRGLIDSLPAQGNLPGMLKTARHMAEVFTQVYGGRCEVEVKA